eukprot:TRINITY_DN88793_c0_g1_i1.p1 TRINITY_DN88793_c0_g1~~TRINITY_DN88793_c0_g1_i1.p1  ORF type:complete len:485 (-),score=41.22 TRINITY_DN88793_c0_g1_i1:79-1533(-)
MAARSSIWNCMGRCHVFARVALQIMCNTVRMHIEDIYRRVFPAQYAVLQEPPEIQRLQANAQLEHVASSMCDSRDVSHAVAAGLAEMLGEMLVFCSIKENGRCACVSKEFQYGAAADALWRCLCLLRWQNKQHSAHIRRWLLGPGTKVEVEDLITTCACSEHECAMHWHSQGGSAVSQTPRRCRVSSWRDRYIFAERDAQRLAISRDELCWDVPYDFNAMAFGGDIDGHALKQQQRRFAMTLDFGHSFNVEGFFHSDGNFFDTGRFKHRPAAWKFSYGPEGEVMVQICPEGIEFAPLRVTRTTDWGWRLTTTGRLADMVHFESRQLSPAGHLVAARISSDIVTLYLRRQHEVTDPRHETTPLGVWQCMRVYQGAMVAPSWIGRNVTIEENSFTITLSRTVEQTYHIELNEMERFLNILQNSHNDESDHEPMSAEHCVYQVELNGQVLVVVRNQQRGGPRPVGLPQGLPSAREALDDPLVESISL